MTYEHDDIFARTIASRHVHEACVSHKMIVVLTADVKK